MEYISKFIVVDNGTEKMDIDVTQVESVTGTYDKAVIRGIGGTVMSLRIGRERIIKLIEERRKQLWEAEQKAVSVHSQLLLEIVKNTTPPVPDPEATIEAAKKAHLSEFPESSPQLSA